MNRDRETDLSKRLEKAQEEIARLRMALNVLLRSLYSPVYPDEIRAREQAYKALEETKP